MSKNDRIYNVADADLIENAEVVKETLPDDLSDFSGFDLNFAADYPLVIANSLTQFYDLKPDMVIVNEQAELTQTVIDSMGACNKAFKTVLFFANKAFGNNPAVMKQFGSKGIEKARRSQANLTLFMDTLAETAVSYKTQLVAEGCSEEFIDGLAILATNLKTANISQEKFKKERGLITQERVRSLNDIYKLLKPVHEIAQIIYSDDPARLDKYSLPTPKSSNNNVNDLVHS